MTRTSPFVRRLGWLLVGGSVALHFLTVVAYYRQPDSLAAFTVMPFWVWGGLGVLASATAFALLRAPLSLIITAIWAFTVFLGADEASVIANLGTPAPRPGQPDPVDGVRPIRVLTVNCAWGAYGDPAKDIAAWNPDIVLLQEVDAVKVQRIATIIFGADASYRAYSGNGIATRWDITREVRNPNPTFRFFNHNATVRLPDGRTIEVANIHLTSAATDLSVWRPSCWVTHRENRKQRRFEVAIALRVLEDTCSFPEVQPVIMAGDFNAPATDPIKDQLDPYFVDAFEAAGTGWGDTFQRRIPVLRLDRILTTRHFTPVRCRAVTTRQTDHRMVVADLLLE